MRDETIIRSLKADRVCFETKMYIICNPSFSVSSIILPGSVCRVNFMADMNI